MKMSQDVTINKLVTLCQQKPDILQLKANNYIGFDQQHNLKRLSSNEIFQEYQLEAKQVDKAFQEDNNLSTPVTALTKD